MRRCPWPAALLARAGADHFSGVGQAWLHSGRQQDLGADTAGAACPPWVHLDGLGAEATHAPVAAVSPTV